MERLSPGNCGSLGYDPRSLDIGIVHLGAGALPSPRPCWTALCPRRRTLTARASPPRRAGRTVGRW